jgi:hypothetical protein
MESLATLTPPSFAKRSKHLPPPLALRIIRILDLPPTVLRIDASLPLADNPLKIPLANFLEEQLAVSCCA